jgi:arginine transport system substrate-binding protein
MCMILKKIFVFTLVAMTLLILLAACNPAEDKPIEGTLVVGVEGSYPPYEFMDVNGKLIGFDLDVAQRLAQALDKQLVVKTMEFEGLILSLKQGKIDLIISGMSITPSRLKEIEMVPYQGHETTAFSLIFWKTIPMGVNTLQDLANIQDVIVSVESGAIQEEYLKQIPNIQMKSLQGALQPLMDIKFGKSTAYLADPDVAAYLQSRYPNIKTLIVPLSEDERPLGCGIGINKENVQLVSQVKKIVQNLKASGELKKLEQQWFYKESL